MNNPNHNHNTYDANKGVSWINYDQWGNPIRVQFTDHSITEHVYTAGIEKTPSDSPLKREGSLTSTGSESTPFRRD
jgi:hypothetical protein